MVKPMVYLAQPMSGREWPKIIEEASEAVLALEREGFDVWSPTLHEASNGNARGTVNGMSRAALKRHWERDFDAIQRADALVSLRGDIPSEGVGYEIAIAEHFMAMPVVVVLPNGATNRVSHLGAKIVPSVSRAAKVLKRFFELELP